MDRHLDPYRGAVRAAIRELLVPSEDWWKREVVLRCSYRALQWARCKPGMWRFADEGEARMKRLLRRLKRLREQAGGR